MSYEILILQILILLVILIIHDHSFHFDGLAYGVIPKSLYFGDNINISRDNSTSEFPQIAASGNNVYVVWEEEDDKDDTNGNKEIYFTSSLDGGSTFGSIKNLSETNGTSEFPQIAASGNNVYVVWEEQGDKDDTNGNKEIFLRPSSDDGSSFKLIRNISRTLTGTSQFPQIAASGNNVYVVWEDDSNGNKDIYFKASPNSGYGFKGKKNLSGTNGTSEFPQIAASGNKVYVVWEDDTNGNKEIYFKASQKTGKIFKNTKKISNTTGTSQSPSIGLLNNETYVIWQDENTTDLQSEKLSKINNEKRIFFKHAKTDKMFFGGTNILESIGNTQSPKLTAGSDYFFGIWIANLPNNKSTIEFYPFGYFEDYSGTGIVLDDQGVKASNPSMAVSGPNLFVVWQDTKLGNSDIFFKKISQLDFLS
jgi:hypothetical protein